VPNVGCKTTTDEYLDFISAKIKLKGVFEDAEFNEVWSDSLKEVAWWLKDSMKKKDSNAVKTVVGLIKYDAITKEDLQNVGRGDYVVFEKDLSAKGVPDAICDLLFQKHVAIKKSNARNGSGGSIENSMHKTFNLLLIVKMESTSMLHKLIGTIRRRK